MEIIKLEETGYNEALMGLSLSFYDHKEAIETWWDEGKFDRAAYRAKSLAFKGGGHNKFLASIFVWVYVQAPRCWWSEYDTYKVATTANSSSTMHTLAKRPVEKLDFEEGTRPEAINNLNNALADYHNKNSEFYHSVTYIKLNLPESYLQERQICINYMTLQNIVKQRRNHRLIFWDMFCDSILSQIDHPDLIEASYGTNTRTT